MAVIVMILDRDGRKNDPTLAVSLASADRGELGEFICGVGIWSAGRECSYLPIGRPAEINRS
jgi:hypothetical protein